MSPSWCSPRCSASCSAWPWGYRSCSSCRLPACRGREEVPMKSYWLAALVCLIVALAAALYPRDSAAQIQRGRLQWEYKALRASRVAELAPKSSTDTMSDGLTVLGAEGWEMVAVDPPIVDP